MQAIRRFLVLVLFTAAVLTTRAQGLFMVLDSLVEAGTAHYNTEVPIGNNDSVQVYAHLVNRTDSIVDIYQYSIGFGATYNGFTIDTGDFYWVATAETLGRGDSVSIRFVINNSIGNPLPDISPGGGSVVIWPIYFGYTHDSIDFTLIYSVPSSGNGGEFLYQHNNLSIVFPMQQQRLYQLYDITGRRVFIAQGDDLINNFNLDAFATGIYIMRVTQGANTQAFKFSKY
jgi:hypothetical protein